MEQLRQQTVLRYITPLREGGSLPALAEADDGFKYVVKFRGTGHGPKALIAELVGALVARRLGLRVPEAVFLDIDERFGITEPDPEIQDLLKASRGPNFGLHFLDGTLTLDPYVNPVDASTASTIVWLDAFLTNVDRTARNTNMLVWHGNETWLIDHGASLYFQHSWTDPVKAALTPFAYIKDHVLLRKASQLEQADAEARRLITQEFIDEVVDQIPDSWLQWPDMDQTPEQLRQVYRTFLTTRLENSQIFLNQAITSRHALV